MKLYAYCLTDEDVRETLANSEGVGGAEAYAIRHAGLSAVVSRFGDESVAVKPENVRAHGRVISRVMQQTTPLPFRFGTIAIEARLLNYLRANETALHASLERVRGCVEMGVKIIWDAEAARREAEDAEAVRADAATGARQIAGRGTAFLTAKRRELSGGEKLKERAGALAAWLDAQLSGVVRESSVRVSPSESLVVRAAHLVERGRLEEYRARLDALRADERARDIRFLTSGAWPPYSFSEVRS
ncbi:MAG TPA: GvpL/GvpF family gas vesicle protein [Pyrinomonadaceae bacterium]|jgi:hypothetical protein|nr:GvpL/GvpF family gas vesicle protein [Pyrinomonadaceae bacterium]